MRVSELSRRSGVPLPTIKFYIREKLLPAGTATAKNQADYTEEHLARLALIRSLRDDAGLSIDAIGRALRAADSAKRDFIAAAIDALQRPSNTGVSERSAAFREAQEVILSLCAERGWNLERAELSVRDAARALVVIHRSFPEERIEGLKPYLDVAEHLAKHEIPDDWQPGAAPNAALRYAILGTVLFEPLILALRRAAHIVRAREMEKKATQASTARATSGGKTR